uniref:Uncharacterized protein n=1 Tax=Pithovirus LCPAC202 TaxID=2506592 RepID=A0A481Z8W1_9VIRU|nr:MAG: hypothetical protein LCPAC202_00950 [Pithovirus LCPAC202]
MDQTETETRTYDDFHDSFQKLLKVLSSVLKDLAKYGYDVKSNDNILKATKALNYYMSCYHNTKPKERYLHFEIFEKIFNNHRESIVADTPVTNKWLKSPHQVENTTSKTMIKIVFKQTKEYDVTLYIGFIYIISLQIRIKAEENLKNATDEEYDECDAIFYPEWILLYLKKIFREFASRDEKRDFITQIGILENNLEVDQESSSGLGGNLSGIADMVANLMQNTGNSSTGAGGIDIAQIGNTLSNVMNNKGVQTSLSEMMNGLTNSNNLEDVVKTISDKIKDPRLTDVFQQEVNKATNTQKGDSQNTEESSSAGKEHITNQTPTNETIENNPETDQTITLEDTSEDEIIVTSGAVPVIIGTDQ